MKKRSSLCLTTLFALLFMFGAVVQSTWADTTTADPTMKYTNTIIPAPITVNDVLIQELGVTGINDGYFTITIPSSVKLSQTDGTAITRDTSTLGTAASPKSLYIDGDEVDDGDTTANRKTAHINIGSDSSVAILTVIALDDTTGTNSLMQKAFYTTSGTAIVPEVAKWSDLTSTEVTTTYTDNVKVGQIYFDETTKDTVITLAVKANSLEAEGITLHELTLLPAVTSATGVVSVALADGKADGTAGAGVTADAEIKVLTMVNQPAAVSGTASGATEPSVAVGAVVAQPSGQIVVTTVGNANNDDNKITIALDNGAKFHSSAVTTLQAGITSTIAQLQADLRASGNGASIAINASGELVLTLGSENFLDTKNITIPAGSAIIDSSEASIGDINATVTGTGTDLNALNATVKVATAADKAVSVEFLDDTTTGFTKLFAGRTGQTIAATEGVRIKESAPQSLLESGSVVMTLDAGAKFTANDNITDTRFNDATYTDTNIDLTDITTASSAKNTVTTGCAVGSDGALGALDLQSFNFDLTGATTGDLNVAFSGTSSISGTVKVAEIVNATATTLSGAAPSVVKGVSYQLPDIVITENSGGALNAAHMMLRFPSTVTLDQAATVKITATPVNGSASTSAITGEFDDAQTFDMTVVTGSTPTSGPYTVTISGLVATISTTAGSGDISFTIAGDNDGTYDVINATSDTGAKPTKESIVFAQVVSDNLVTIGTVSVADGIVSFSIIPAGNNLGQVGDWYVTAGSKFYDGSAWVDTETAIESGATLAEKAFTIPTSELAAGSKVFVGYGVGLTGTYATMNTNGTFGKVYTVPAAVSVDKATVQMDVAATETITIADGTAPYTIASDDETVATVSPAELAAAGTFDITGVTGEGSTATITVTDANGATATVAVTVGTEPIVPPEPKEVPSAPDEDGLTTPVDPATAGVTVGDVVTGGDNMEIKAAMGPYAAAVDIYVLIGLADGSFYFVDADSKLTTDFVVFRDDVTEAVAATIVPSFPICNPFTGAALLPEGTMSVWTLVVPGETATADLDFENGSFDIDFYTFEISCGGETPADETPADETPADETPADETPADETPAE